MMSLDFLTASVPSVIMTPAAASSQSDIEPSVGGNHLPGSAGLALTAMVTSDVLSHGHSDASSYGMLSPVDRPGRQ